MLSFVLVALVAAGMPDAGAKAESTLKPAYMVIATGAKTQAEADSGRAKYRASGLPWYRVASRAYSLGCNEACRAPEFPMVVASDTVKGLNPGFWIVVAMVTEHKEVADTLNTFLHGSGLSSYVRPVEVPQVADVKLLIVDHGPLDRAGVGSDFSGGMLADFEVALRGLTVVASQGCPGNRAGCGYVSLERGGSLFSKRKRAVVPYVLSPDEGDLLYFGINFGGHMDYGKPDVMEGIALETDPVLKDLPPTTERIHSIRIKRMRLVEYEMGD
jgi:hypothetical protein